MSRHWTLAAAVAVLLPATAITAPVHDPSSPQPALVLRVQPIDRLLADVRHVLGRFDDPEGFRKFAATLFDPLGPRSLAGSGLDPRRPWGGYAVLRADWTESAAVLVVPVTDERAVLELLERLDRKATPLGDGLFTFTPSDDWGPAYLRFAFGYAYVTVENRAVLALNQLVSPSRLFPPDETATASAVVRFDQIPEPLRKQAGAELTELRDESDPSSDPDDTDLDEQLDRAHWRALCRWGKLLADDGRELTVSARFDRASGELRFDAALSGRGGSVLSAAFRGLPRSRSLFAALTEREAALNLHVVTPLPPEHRAALVSAVAKDPGSILDNWDLAPEDEKVKAAAVRVVRALLPTLRAGRLDCALSLRGPESDRFGVVAGLRIKGSDRVDRAIRRLIAALPESDRANVKLDAERIGGVAVHRLSFTSDDGLSSDDVKKVFGDQPAYWAVRQGAVLVAFGQGGLEAIRETLLRLRPRPVPALRFESSTRHLQTLVDRCVERTPIHLRKTFGAGVEHVRFLWATWEGGSRLGLRAAVNVQALVGTALAFDADEDEAGLVPPVEPTPPAAQPPAPLPPGPPPMPAG
jgi:hypothetical protein